MIEPRRRGAVSQEAQQSVGFGRPERQADPPHGAVRASPAVRSPNRSLLETASSRERRRSGHLKARVQKYAGPPRQAEEADSRAPPDVLLEPTPTRPHFHFQERVRLD